MQTVLSPGPLNRQAVLVLLAQWAQQDASLILLSTINDFADKISAVCNGHPGLVGLCCSRLAAEAEEAAARGQGYSAAEFERFLSWSLPNLLQSLPAYRELLTRAGYYPRLSSLFFQQVRNALFYPT